MKLVKSMYYQSEEATEKSRISIVLETWVSSSSWAIGVEGRSSKWVEPVSWLLTLPWVLLSLLFFMLPHLLCLTLFNLFLQYLIHVLHILNCQFRLIIFWLLVKGFFWNLDPLFNLLDLFTRVVFDWFDSSTDHCIDKFRQLWQLLINNHVLFLSRLDHQDKFFEFPLNFSCFCLIIFDFFKFILNSRGIIHKFIEDSWIDKMSCLLVSVDAIQLVLERVKLWLKIIPFLVIFHNWIISQNKLSLLCYQSIQCFLWILLVEAQVFNFYLLLFLSWEKGWNVLD